MLLKKLDDYELALLEVLEHPLFCSQFLRNEFDPTWEHTEYQQDILSDCNSYISFRAARSSGKSETLLDKVIYFGINDFFTTQVISIVTPNRVHLTPLWRKIVQWLNMHPFIRHYSYRINSQIYDIQFANGVTIDCRIAGVAGTGSTVIGLHTPVLFVDEAGFLNWITWTELLPTINSWEEGFQVYVCGTPSGEREDNVLYFTDQISSQYNKYRITALQNPRYTEDNYKRDIEQYGGEDSDDFKRLVLGEHASPVVRIFSRDSIHTGMHEFFSGTISYKDLEQDPDKVRRLLSSLPTTKDKVACGIDLGFSDPTIISIFRFHDNHWINFVRITLERIEYPQQINFIDKLDTIYNFSFLAIDEGNIGIAVSQQLISNEYANKDYASKVVSIQFGHSVEVGTDLDGNEIKLNVRNAATEKLRSLIDNKKLIFYEKDSVLLSELERVESVRTSSGRTVYRVRSQGGSLAGDDHIFSSLLCFAYALYLEEDYRVAEAKVKLFGGRWSKY